MLAKRLLITGVILAFFSFFNLLFAQYGKLIIDSAQWKSDTLFVKNNAFPTFYQNIPFDTAQLNHFASWAGSDTSLAEIESPTFEIPPIIGMYLAGTPITDDGNRLYITTESSEIFNFPISVQQYFPEWTFQLFQMPDHLIGQKAKLIAIDNSKGYAGWIGITEPFETWILSGGVAQGHQAVYQGINPPKRNFQENFQFYGTYMGGDHHQGTFESGFETVGSFVEFFVCGMPNSSHGNKIQFRNSENEIHEISELPIDKYYFEWTKIVAHLPSNFANKKVQLIGKDNSTALAGWFGVSSFEKSSFLVYFYSKLKAYRIEIALALAIFIILFHNRLRSTYLTFQPKVATVLKHGNNLTLLGYLLTTLFFFFLIYIRRPDQIWNPQIWSEDGTQNFLSYMQFGWENMWMPVNGYLITISKLIINTSASISILHLPEISTFLTCVFTILVALTVFLSPTTLKYPFFCAVAILFVPIAPEPVAIPLYTFWTSAFLLFLVPLWKDNQKIYSRIFILLLAGLSSPAIIILVPLLLFNYIFCEPTEKKKNLVLLGVSGLVAAIQVYFILNGAASKPPVFSTDFLYIFPANFFGRFWTGWTENDMVAVISGFLLIAFTIYCFIKTKSKNNFFLGYLLAATIALSLFRLDYHIIHPQLGGARYFYFPFVLLGWYVIDNYKVLPRFVSAVLLSAAITTLTFLTKGHDDLHWKETILTKIEEPGALAILPVHTSGLKNENWIVTLDKANLIEKLGEEYDQEQKEQIIE